MIYEEFIIENIYNETIQFYMQEFYLGDLLSSYKFMHKNITPAPAAIIFSLEGVFATITAWFLLNQILGINNLLGCFFILCGVLLSQLLPLIKKSV